MHCVRYLDDISSLITLACCVAEVHTSECIGEDENCPANTFSVANGQTLQVHNSCIQEAMLRELNLMQYDNQGNPESLVNKK